MFKIILFYKYIEIENPQELKDSQKALCEKLELKGRMIIAKEGINATLEGTEENISEYMEELKKDPRFSNSHFKISDGTGLAFPKLSIKVRNEIVSLGLGEEDFNPSQTTGKYLTAEELHNWFRSGREFYIVDMRNDYELVVGQFENSINLEMENFRDLPKALPKIESLKYKTIVSVCTGGVRCEKASGFLVKNGFKDVYQLLDGIVTYMEKYPGEDFKGSLYVFDNRIVMGFNTDPNREILGKCASCGKPSENYINCKDDFCHRHFICCKECLDQDSKKLCPMGCRKYRKDETGKVEIVSNF